MPIIDPIYLLGLVLLSEMFVWQKKKEEDISLPTEAKTLRDF